MGDLFGDEGSAYWISIKGLNAFTRMSDGRLPVGPLYEALRIHLELEGDLDLVDVVLNRWQGGRSEIAALSRIVVGAAETGDECAAQILSEAADELAGLVDATRRILDFGPEEKVPVSYSAVCSMYAPSSTASKRPSGIFTTGTGCVSPCIRQLSGQRSTRPNSQANH